MSKGNIIATGAHNELLNNSKEYKNLYEKQILN
jgi:ABC-type multidrug transport system fused ATPase/permease subunit